MHELVRIFRLIAYPILILVLLHTLNISIGNLLIGAGFLGIVIGLAAQSTLGNAFAGISILYANPFKAGDKITFTPSSYGIQAPTHPHETMFTEIIGTVRSVGIIYTRIMKDDSSLMYVPNSVITQGFIQNMSRINERLIRIRLDVSRNTDFELFRLKLDEMLSENREDYEKLLGLHVKISFVSTDQDLGIIVTARTKVLDYDSISQWLSETAVKALLETQREQDDMPNSGNATKVSTGKTKGKKNGKKR
jgi:small-conductance mechanosensitive channel